MKRRIASGAAVGLALFLGLVSGCSEPAPVATPTPSGPASHWTAPPQITGVSVTAEGLRVQGLAEPEGRVVLRRESGTAYAASSDAEGRFEIRMAAPADDLMLIPEAQIGQDSVPAPERLLILRGGNGPIVLLRSGRASLRLDAAPVLGAIDSDGRVLLASGRTGSTSQNVPVSVGDGPVMRVTPDDDGRWSAVLNRAGGGEVTIRVRDAAFAYPGDSAPAGGAFSVQRAGWGWRVNWTSAAGAAQTTWLPVRPD
ncbi:hypothetical protein [uncultured Brevundimonas sp.]|uniref:hypothetical protein n=1 Tax=uncultured Brevundimonas sp. TaxID=213418 RepID=UPI0030EF3476|tara:strand:+ start:27854 stop:28618 length:765 start_codon:yes stop_codon:yes gene_type:complete